MEDRFDEYSIGQAVGKGKFAVVYKAVRKSDGKIVAYKNISLHDMTDEKSREKCLKEVQILQQLNHENIIACLDTFVHENHLVLILEWAEAGDLKRQIMHAQKRSARFSERVVWKYFYQMSAAVRYMHSKRVMHRDLKPANIFLTSSAMIKVGDLGLGRMFSDETIQAFSKVGTPLYMSPEVLKGKGYEFKSDIWSLGCILYELCVLRSPFKEEGINLYQLFNKINEGVYAPLPDYYSADLRSLCHSMLCVLPEDRPDIESVASVSMAQSVLYENRKRQEDQKTDEAQKRIRKDELRPLPIPVKPEEAPMPSSRLPDPVSEPTPTPTPTLTPTPTTPTPTTIPSSLATSEDPQRHRPLTSEGIRLDLMGVSAMCVWKLRLLDYIRRFCVSKYSLPDALFRYLAVHSHLPPFNKEVFAGHCSKSLPSPFSSVFLLLVQWLFSLFDIRLELLSDAVQTSASVLSLLPSIGVERDYVSSISLQPLSTGSGKSACVVLSWILDRAMAWRGIEIPTTIECSEAQPIPLFELSMDCPNDLSQDESEEESGFYIPPQRWREECK